MVGTEENIRDFNVKGFWEKLQRYARKLGRETIEKVLILLYALQDPQVPGWAKSVIVGALGYFILPADAIPDILPGGYSDDMGVLLGALGSVMAYVSPETIKRARKRAEGWFSEERQEG